MRTILIAIIGMLITTPAIAKHHHHSEGTTHHHGKGHHRKESTSCHKQSRLHIIVAPVDVPQMAKIEVMPDSPPPEDNFNILADYAYSETQPPEKPADTIKMLLAGVETGSVREEIRRVADILGLNVGLAEAFAQIESDFNPHDRTGSYLGLYQLSRHEFDRYGPTGGDIFNARDNAIAAMLKIEIEANIFKIDTRHIPSYADLYLIHQQGLQGAARHLEDPNRPAWKSMCATDEGKQRGTGWCRKAIWGNTLPAFKHIWKSVEEFTSGAFVKMWADRVSTFLRR